MISIGLLLWYVLRADHCTLAQFLLDHDDVVFDLTLIALVFLVQFFVILIFRHVFLYRSQIDSSLILIE